MRTLRVPLDGPGVREAWEQVKPSWSRYAARHEARLQEGDAIEVAPDEIIRISPTCRVSETAPSLFEHPNAWSRRRFWAEERRERFPFLEYMRRHSWSGRTVGRALRDHGFLDFAGCEQDLAIVPQEPARDRGRGQPGPPLALSDRVRTVALFLYNRADLTGRVFAAIRAARPRTLFLIADGPDPAIENDRAHCLAARAICRVDWDCDVRIHFSEEHLGQRARFESGLGLIFSRVDEAILLEDDTLPSAEFFPYCEAMLEQYRHEPRVLSIGGAAMHFGLIEDEAGHVFSRYPISWGWATWRRAIRHYDPHLRRPPSEPDTREWLARLLGSRQAAAYWHYQLEGKREPTWDMVWARSSFIAGGLHAMPTRNLVSNIGFRSDATHTKGASPHAARPLEALGAAPTTRAIEASADLNDFLEETLFGGNLSRALARARPGNRDSSEPPSRQPA